jgi:hypothetical protein
MGDQGCSGEREREGGREGGRKEGRKEEIEKGRDGESE